MARHLGNVLFQADIVISTTKFTSTHVPIKLKVKKIKRAYPIFTPHFFPVVAYIFIQSLSTKVNIHRKKSYQQSGV